MCLSCSYICTDSLALLPSDQSLKQPVFPFSLWTTGFSMKQFPWLWHHCFSGSTHLSSLAPALIVLLPRGLLSPTVLFILCNPMVSNITFIPVTSHSVLGHSFLPSFTVSNNHIRQFSAYICLGLLLLIYLLCAFFLLLETGSNLRVCSHSAFCLVRPSMLWNQCSGRLSKQRKKEKKERCSYC